jgi:hypothetical protein
VVEADNLTDEAIDGLREKYREVRAVDDGVEIDGEEVSLYDIEDLLRPKGVAIKSMYKKQITLDDVFLHLTGKQLRE